MTDKKIKQVEPGVWKLENGKYLLHFRPGGRTGPQIKRQYSTLTDLRQQKNIFIARHEIGETVKPKRDKRRLSDLCQQWFDLHGHTLGTGTQRLRILKYLAAALGDPIATNCEPSEFIDYRKDRIDNGTSINHVNHELTYIKAVFNELERVNKWSHAKPYDRIKKIKLPSSDLCFLYPDEITDLLRQLEDSRNEHALTIAKICLSTGCRWGEASGLQGENIRKGKTEAGDDWWLMTFVDTKNGDNRSVPVNSELVTEIFHDRPRRGELFPGTSEGAFRKALDRAKITLPRGQLTHVLRHTFASHFVMNGGDILTLNKILGHKTIQMTMVYAHLAPNYLSKALDLNPLTKPALAEK